MRKSIAGAIGLQACLLLAFAGTAAAQDKAPEAFIYATYHVCDITKQERADEIFEQLQKPIYDAAVADGTITNYGWLVHHTGGKWRRGIYYGATSVQGLLDAQEKIGDQIDAKNKKLDTEFGQICNSHDDYIWHRIAGNIGTVARGGAAFSTYSVCDVSREEQADEIVKQVFAPVMDKYVADGKLKSWGWIEHVVGGSIRRTMTISATDMKTLMATRAEIVEKAFDSPMGDIFTDICGDHADYMWEIKFANPKHRGLIRCAGGPGIGRAPRPASTSPARSGTLATDSSPYCSRST
jgi:hypothetical protein